MTMSKFKQELLTRFQGADEGEVKEYLGCEVIRDRAARTGKMVHAGYAERVLRTSGIDRPFIVLTETKFSFRCIPVWIGTLLTGLGSKKKHM